MGLRKIEKRLHYTTIGLWIWVGNWINISRIKFENDSDGTTHDFALTTNCGKYKCRIGN